MYHQGSGVFGESNAGGEHGQSQRIPEEKFTTSCDIRETFFALSQLHVSYRGDIYGIVSWKENPGQHGLRFTSSTTLSVASRRFVLAAEGHGCYITNIVGKYR